MLKDPIAPYRITHLIVWSITCHMESHKLNLPFGKGVDVFG